MIKNLKIDENLEKYIRENSYDLHPVQKNIIEYNNSLGSQKKMQISVTQSYFFQFLIKTNNIKNILEIGTFTGYSALTMALALPKNGKITCLDINEETSKKALSFFKKAKLDNLIEFKIGPALKSLNEIKQQNLFFDMIFIDADKENYKNYFSACFNLIKNTGFIIIDNVLWHGDVADPNKNDKLTSILREFNSFLKKDDRIEKTILPLGDGITICRKI
tara:strand:- start:641 stop:1297 length:657 start_codon:yes stop_codon:yes gene_type:complete